MEKTLRCRDLGPDCDFVVRADDEDGVMRRAAEHARDAHGIDPVPPELATRARAHIRDGDLPLERHEPPHTTRGPITAPKFGAAGSGGLEYERLPERHDADD